MSSPEYLKQYYTDNKERINADRRVRYYTDPDYRERVLAVQQEYRDRNRKQVGPRPPQYLRARVFEAGDGEPIYLYTMAYMGMYLDRSPQSLGFWEDRRQLPPTPYRDHERRGFRYYTIPMMDVVGEVLGGRLRMFPVDPDQYQQVLDGWVALGVPMGAPDLRTAVTLTKGMPSISHEYLVKRLISRRKAKRAEDGTVINVETGEPLLIRCEHAVPRNPEERSA